VKNDSLIPERSNVDPIQTALAWLEQMPNAAWLADAGGVVIAVNRCVVELIGLPEVELIGHGYEFARIVHPDDRDALLERWRRAWMNLEDYCADVRVRTASRGYRWLHLEARALRSERQEITGWLGSATDIHELKSHALATEAALHGQRESYRQALERMSDAFVQIETNDVIAQLNFNAEKILGRTSRDLVGENFWDVFPEGRATGFELEYRRVLDTGKPVVFETHFAVSQSWFEVRMFPTGDGTAVFLHDVTNLEALRQREAINRGVLESSPDCLKLLDLEGRLLHMNEFGMCLMEIDDFEPLRFDSWSELWPIEARADLQRALEDAKAGGRGRFQGFCPTAKGAPKWWDVIVTPVRDDAGDIQHLFAASRDITSLHLVQQRLRENETRFRLLAENALDMITLHDPEGKYLYASPACERITGYTATELIGCNAYAFFHPDDLEVIRHSHGVVLKGEAFSVEYRLRRKDGSYVWLETTNRAVLEEGTGRILEIQASSRDVTEHKSAEQALRASEERYRELSQAQQRFVSDASHELRAPLTAIGGSLQLLERHPDLEAVERQQIAREAYLEVGRLSRLITDLLAVARGDANSQREPVILELHTLLQRSWEGAKHLSDGHEFVVECLEPCEVVGDADRLTQVALILLENAVKYTPSGGTVRLGLRNDGEHLVFWVGDDGPGIAPEDQPRVFERFYRSAAARQGDPGGTGLGLAIARQIVKAHHGEIRLESRLGHGTTVIVRLPCALSDDGQTS
jgi:PAS domain S-box-containing protein